MDLLGGDLERRVMAYQRGVVLLAIGQLRGSETAATGRKVLVQHEGEEAAVGRNHRIPDGGESLRTQTLVVGLRDP